MKTNSTDSFTFVGIIEEIRYLGDTGFTVVSVAAEDNNARKTVEAMISKKLHQKNKELIQEGNQVEIIGKKREYFSGYRMFVDRIYQK